MKKKIIRIMAAAFMITASAAACLSLTGCHFGDHEYDSGTIIKKATCTEAGERKYTCTIEGCEESYTEEIAAKGHNYETTVLKATCTEDGYTKTVCVNCGDSSVTDRVSATGHNYVDTVVEPTCTKNGYTNHKCSGCGDSYSDTQVDALGHDYQITSKTQGDGYYYIVYTCSHCGKSYTESVRTHVIGING